MIWESTLWMTIFDTVILGISLVGLRILSRWSQRLKARQPIGAWLIAGGLLLLGSLYLVDLLAMWVLPHILTPARAMTFMENLHLNYSWIVNLVAMLSVLAGLWSMARAMEAHERRHTHTDDDRQRPGAGLLSRRDVAVAGPAQCESGRMAFEALRLSEERFSSAFHASPDGITLTSITDNRLVELNPGFERLLATRAERH